MRLLRVLLVAFAVGACSSQRILNANEPVKVVTVDYKVIDSPQTERILVSYTNNGPTAVCFGPENWPSNGILLNNGLSTSLEIGHRVFPLEAEQDYCPHCTTRVEPGSKSIAFFKYSSFKVPVDLRRSEKKLSFHPVGFECR